MLFAGKANPNNKRFDKLFTMNKIDRPKSITDSNLMGLHLPKHHKSDDNTMRPENAVSEAEEQEALFKDKNNKKSDTLEMFHSDEDDKLNTLEDGRKSKLEFQKLQTLDCSVTICAVVGAFITIYTYDLEFGDKDSRLLKDLLWVIFSTTIVTIILDVMRYQQKLNFMKARNIISQKENLYSSGVYWGLVVEIFLLLLQPYPFLTDIQVEDKDQVEGIVFYYDLNDLLSVLIVVRIYLVARILLNATKYRSPRARRLSSLYGAENDYLYAYKCLMRHNSLICVTVLLGVSIFIFGYMLRICERPLRKTATTLPQMSTYWNSMWCVILTMTTVGYGDFYAKTHFGRIVSFLCCIWGVFVVSLVVVTLTNILSMSAAEEKALIVLERLQLRKELKAEAANVLTNMTRVGLNNRKSKGQNNSETQSQNKKLVEKIKKDLSNFKQTSRQIKSLDDSGNINEEMTRQFEFLRDEIKDIKSQQVHLMSAFKQLADIIEPKVKDEFSTSRYPEQEGSGISPLPPVKQ